MNSATIKKGFVVALLVGTILLIINQYDVLAGNSELRVIPAILTYLTPFFVFIAGQYSASRERVDKDSSVS
ncbi:MAG: hypothetical protein COA96_03220 [SAR86 cluster bacterium]|uniref:Dihydrolipoamide dehydrogenase n=1 Tax=SAR86 cluster bacterium TaxID=2030880 RepID=A0A2A5B7G9_9GAMM|nr:MAG: hypothetical protein COA96_03220 [SAR86 cluster bacterium]